MAKGSFYTHVQGLQSLLENDLRRSSARYFASHKSPMTYTIKVHYTYEQHNTSHNALTLYGKVSRYVSSHYRYTHSAVPAVRRIEFAFAVNISLIQMGMLFAS